MLILSKIFLIFLKDSILLRWESTEIHASSCLETDFHKVQAYNFENWVNGEVSKIGHHFSKETDLKIDANKKCAPKLIFFNEKMIPMIFDIEN